MESPVNSVAVCHPVRIPSNAAGQSALQSSDGHNSDCSATSLGGSVLSGSHPHTANRSS
jgi:hypothetical protein